MADSNTNLLVGVILSVIAGVSLGLLIAQLFNKVSLQRNFAPQPQRSIVFDRDDVGRIIGLHSLMT